MNRFKKAASVERLSNVLVAALVVVVGAVLATRAGAASLSSVQSGATTSTAAGTLSVPIDTVDPARAFLVFDARHDSGRPVASTIRGRLASPTTLEFVRVTNEATPAPISIRWYVAEFASGVRVQRGESPQSPAVLNIPISPVAAVSQAFVTWSKTPQPTDQNNLDGDDPIIGELTSTANLQFRADTARTDDIISWQVIEFTSAADVRVQKGSTSLTTGALSVDVTLAPADAVDTSSTFLLVGYNTSGSGNDIGARMLRARLVDSTTIRIERGLGGNNDDLTEIHWQLVELKDGSEVIRGTTSLATGVAQAVAGLGGRKVDLGGAVALATVQPEAGQSMGMSTYSGDDVMGVCSVTTDLSPSSVTLTRANTAGTCDVAWSVVQFAPTLTTAVTLKSFAAEAGDREVLLVWETGSELDNLGFHLYRSETASGPWQRITASLIPGLGSSPDGATYSYRDLGLANGTTWYYLLEDVETTGRTKRHGPVEATPREELAGSPEGAHTADPEAPGADDRTAWIRYGTPDDTDLRVVGRGAGSVEVELRTGGFWAWPDPEGGVRLWIPGFEDGAGPGTPALPVRLAWLEAVAGRRVKIAAVVGDDEATFSSLQPVAAGEPELQTDARGSVVAGEHRRPRGAAFEAAGLYPTAAARIVQVAFQGDVKKAELVLSPLRWDRTADQLRLARRLRVRLVFEGAEPNEVPLGGSRGRSRPRLDAGRPIGVVARLAVKDPGLYAVRFEDVFGDNGRGVPLSELRLSRRGRTVAHRVEPPSRPFGPGSRLLFVTEGAVLNVHGTEAVYELSVGEEGQSMPVVDGAPSGAGVPWSRATRRFEIDRIFQPGLREASDVWLWDALMAGVSKSWPLSVSEVAPASEPARLVVRLQGGTDLPADPDHHVRVRLNESVVAEASWDGRTPFTLEADVAPGILVDGANRLRVDNLGDVAPYSQVFLDGFELTFPRRLRADASGFEGSFAFGGQAEIVGLPAPVGVVDTTDEPPRWLTGASTSAAGTRFRVEAGRRYLAVPADAVRAPEVRPARSTGLRSARTRGEYLVLAPRAFMDAARLLVEQRRREGLEALAVPVEDVYDEFGSGEAHPEAIRAFLAFAWHEWRAAPRYVLLLGDATADFKDNLGRGTGNRVPPYMIRDPYLWTASDPAYAAVNGGDVLPDLALGRLPAATAEEAFALVHKVLDWESAGFDLSGRAVLVSDNSDPAGDFEGDSDRVARTLLADRPVERVYLSRLGSAMRPTIAAAFDAGASLLSYLGHGGIAVWATENVWNNWDVADLSPQAQQPFLLTMDCLNGYFHHPSLNSLSEELVKAEGRGAVGAFAPSSVSVHWAARVYYETLIEELTSGRHERLGDALLAAQERYLDSGARPDLLRTYQLLADPALRIR